MRCADGRKPICRITSYNVCYTKLLRHIHLQGEENRKSLNLIRSVAAVPAMLDACKRALLARDLAAMGALVEADAVMMHAVMMSSRPPLYSYNFV